MATDLVTVRPHETARHAYQLMRDHRFRHLPVVEDGRLVGILTRADIVRAFTRDDSELATEIEDDILRRTFWAEPGSVKVAVADGRVTLAGEVETEADLEMLPLFVSRVPGVVAVNSDLRARSRVA
jgi:CBS domain-containing protein